MRTSTLYGLAGPKTFRRSSKKLFGKGGNLQNWEKSLREILISDGWTLDIEAKLSFWLETGDTSIFTEEELVTIKVILQVDQSGAEALIVAYECTDGDFRQLFIHGIKPHVFVALKLFKDIWPLEAETHGFAAITETIVNDMCRLKISQLKSNPYWKELDKLIKDSDNWPIERRYYYNAKQTCHSANYGIEAGTFILNVLEKSGGRIVLLKEQGEYFLGIYRALFPEIPDRCERIKKQVEQTRMLYNLFGFPYYIGKWEINSSDFKEYYAWSAQSTVAEITRRAYSRLYEYLSDNRKSWDILLDCHDSIATQCPLIEAKECGRNMIEYMNQELISPSDGTKFSMKSEIQIGFNLAPMKMLPPGSIKNKLGLREFNLQ